MAMLFGFRYILLVLHRGTAQEAARALHRILANDDRARCLHAEAERVDPDLRTPVIAAALDRLNNQRASWGRRPLAGNAIPRQVD
jgi:hypothetical protein